MAGHSLPVKRVSEQEEIDVNFQKPDFVEGFNALGLESMRHSLRRGLGLKSNSRKLLMLVL